MNTQLPVILGLLIALVALYLFWTKGKSATFKSDTTRPSEKYLSDELIENDKLVIVKDVNHEEIKAALTGFCNMHNKDAYTTLPRLFKISEREFAITFPYDIDFETFCYFVNYAGYPSELDRTLKVIAWTTTKDTDESIIPQVANKKVMMFLSDYDKEYDNVLMTTSDNIGYKLDFSFNKKEPINTPEKLFVAPAIDLTELVDNEYEDFK